MDQMVSIAGREIGVNYPPFVIAELSGNHQQSLALAKQMIAAAAQAGADAIKLQSYTADSMTLDCDNEDFVIQEQDSLWKGQRLHALYQKAATPYEWHAELFSYAHSLGLIAFSSPFDKQAVDLLASLNVPCYKIASFELTDLPLIAYVAQQGQPVILSTGMASLAEIEEAVNTVKAQGNQQIILLKCTSTYPASAANSHLRTLPHLQQSFNCVVGLSDHTQGIGAAVASVALGASVIEKHFVLDRQAGGVDAAFSLEPAELGALCEASKVAQQALGRVCYGGSEAEEQAKYYRRSIYLKRPIAVGEAFTEQNIQVVRPAKGLAPKYWDMVLGKKARQALPAGTALSWEHLA
ncbi:pseudaminic acid synthase [Agarivorans sp. QJM3NY_33]|uniref:pseudaminic acid synthase n=1 Tax=Agarivorans sp. QJM3NY_33 TaxID=3421432 RepID=UPI003D7E01C4